MILWYALAHVSQKFRHFGDYTATVNSESHSIDVHERHSHQHPAVMSPYLVTSRGQKRGLLILPTYAVQLPPFIIHTHTERIMYTSTYKWWKLDIKGSFLASACGKVRWLWWWRQWCSCKYGHDVISPQLPQKVTFELIVGLCLEQITLPI